MMGWRHSRWLALGVLLLAAPTLLFAQRGGRGNRGFAPVYGSNQPYDGRFTFARVSYTGTREGWWNHDYPDADVNLPLILNSLTAVAPRLHVSNIFDLEDPEMFKFPILYLWEPGYWRITSEGAARLREYLLKGGFIIFDDFEAEQWINFEAQFREALPEAVFVQLDTTHPIYHTFFEVDEVNLAHPTVAVEPAYYGVFEHNDPTRRMMALVNFNSDIAEYWEWSGRGRFPVDLNNNAYKLGVNYMLYGLTH